MKITNGSCSFINEWFNLRRVICQMFRCLGFPNRFDWTMWPLGEWLVTLLQRRRPTSKRSLCAHAVVVSSRGQMQFRRRIVKIAAPQSVLPAPIYMWVLCSCQFHLLSDHSHYAGMQAANKIMLMHVNPGANAFSPGVQPVTPWKQMKDTFHHCSGDAHVIRSSAQQECCRVM